jgi:transposase
VEGGRISSREPALRDLLAKLGKRGALQASLEACGCFIWIFDILSEVLGRSNVHVGQPSRIAVIANSLEKNDANDAWWLAYLLFEGRMPECYVAEGAVRELRIASRELRAYTDERADLLRRLKSHLAQAGKTVPKNWHTSKVRREETKRVLAEVEGERKRAVLALYRNITRLTRQMKYWIERVKALSKALPEVKTLVDEMPGIGEVLGGAVVAELGSPTRFYCAKAYAKATGLTPGYRESGGKGSRTKITRQGSAQARWAFTRAALSCLRAKSGTAEQIKQWVLARSKHKPKKLVIVAAARKLAEGVWRLFNYGEAFKLAAAFPVKKKKKHGSLDTQKKEAAKTTSG